jgi:hypothetical protein
MDHTAARKRPSSARFHKYLPYLAHQDGYQIFGVTSGAQVCGALHRYIQTEMEFLDISSLGTAYRYAIKIEQKLKQKMAIWAWEPLTTKSRKGWPQPTEQRTEKIWTVSGQPVQATRKEGHLERQRKIPGSGATSIRALGITLLIVAQSSHWWPK